MSDNLTLSGQLVITPDPSQSDAALSGDFAINVPLTASLTLSRKEAVTIAIPSDETPNAITVDLTAIVSVHMLAIRTTTPITVAINGNDVAVDDFLLLISETTAITALTVTGSGPAGTVRITMGRV